MKRLNNKGFAISTILFSVLVLGTLVFAILYSTILSNKVCFKDCCEQPCKLPEKEEINTCSTFKDFSCTNEFKIGTEHFCVIKIYDGSSTTTGNKVVVALAKYFVNTDNTKTDIAPYGLQYKYAICEGMHTDSITITQLSNSATMGYYSLLNNDAKINTKIKQSNFTVHPINSDGTTGSNKSYSFYLPKLSTITTVQYNPINTYIIDYYNKLKQINSSLSSLSVRLANIRDINNEDQFPCYSNRNGVNAKVKDDVDGNHTETEFTCNINVNYKWLYTPTATNNFSGNYLIDIMHVDNLKYLKSTFITVDNNKYSINKGYYVSNDFYKNTYFRPVIELSEAEYKNLPKA